jgi:hypothetical protein
MSQVPEEFIRMTPEAALDARRAFTDSSHLLSRKTALDAARVAAYDGDIDDVYQLEKFVDEHRDLWEYKIEFRVAAIQALLIWAWQVEKGAS